MLVPQVNERQLAADHRRFAHAVDYFANKAIATTERHVHEHVQQQSTFHRWKVHSLKDAAHGRHRGAWGSRELKIQAYVDGPFYAPYVELGTRPHAIVARNAPSLYFYWQRFRRYVSFIRVWHPGTKPYRYLWKATKSAYQMFGVELGGALKSAAKSF